MTIVERTPIALPNDQCDTVYAVVYRIGGFPEQSYKLSIDALNSRLENEFTQSQIEELWSEQYPQWNDLIFVNPYN